jgi:hypothetical protein
MRMSKRAMSAYVERSRGGRFFEAASLSEAESRDFQKRLSEERSAKDPANRGRRSGTATLSHDDRGGAKVDRGSS